MNNKRRDKFVHLTRVKSALILLFIFIMSSYKAQDQETGSLKVMTFNLRYGSANDGENSWQYRYENVAAVIKDFKPDLIGFQEALDFQNKELLKMMPEYSIAGVGRDDGKYAGEFSSIFYLKDRFDIDSAKTFWFSDTPEIPGSKNWGNNITRICTWIHIHDKLTGQNFYHFNLHLDHESQLSREKSTQLLTRKIGEKKEPVILTGDFNCGSANAAIKTIILSGMKDSYRLANPKTENEGTFNSFRGETNGEKIDFIFISKIFEVKKAGIVRKNFAGKYPSDHFPVTAELDFPINN